MSNASETMMVSYTVYSPSEMEIARLMNGDLSVAYGQLPVATHVCHSDGGEWIPFVQRRGGAKPVMAIRYDDGSVWDVANGWRQLGRPDL